MKLNYCAAPNSISVFAMRMLTVLFVGTAIMLLVGPASAESAKSEEGAAAAILLPQLDAERGRQLFVDRACVVCHAVNDVGGKAGPSFDAVGDQNHVDVLAFAAGMWRGADPMIVLQAMELGYQIELTGQDLGDLAAFAHDKNAQKGFSLDEVPDLIRDWFIDDPVEYAPESLDSDDQLTE